MDQAPKFKKQELDAPEYQVNPDVKLSAWVICKKCRKGPTGYNWLKPVSTDPQCRIFLHLDCIEEGLSKKFSNQAGGRPDWLADRP